MYFQDVKCEKSFFIFGFDSEFRKSCYYIVMHKLFERIVLMYSPHPSIIPFLTLYLRSGIALSSSKLVWDTYLVDDPYSSSPSAQLRYYFDVLFSAFFTVESLLKIISFGLFLDEGSYLRDSW